MKRAFSLIMAIIFMVIISILGLAALRFATSGVAHTSELFIREQAEILAINSAEFATMAMQSYDYSSDCLEEVIVEYPSDGNPILEANVTIRYFDGNATFTCKAGANDMTLTNRSSYMSEIHGVIDNIALLDIVVKSVGDAKNERIRIHKRVIQRP